MCPNMSTYIWTSIWRSVQPCEPQHTTSTGNKCNLFLSGRSTSVSFSHTHSLSLSLFLNHQTEHCEHKSDSIKSLFTTPSHTEQHVRDSSNVISVGREWPNRDILFELSARSGKSVRSKQKTVVPHALKSVCPVYRNFRQCVCCVCGWWLCVTQTYTNRVERRLRNVGRHKDGYSSCILLFINDVSADAVRQKYQALIASMFWHSARCNAYT